MTAYSSAEDVACRTKRRHDTRAQAKRSLKVMRRRGHRDLVIYQCHYCANYHLGNPPGKQTYTRAGSPPLIPRPRPAADSTAA